MNTDFLNDRTGAVLNYAFENNLLPEFVKEASVDELHNVDGLIDEAFADKYNRLYPCHTKEATVLSALYAAANNNCESSVKDNIVKIASAFQINEEVESIFNHFEGEFEKIASENVEEPIQKFALYLEDDNGTTGYYDISDKENTLVSIKHLEQDFTAGGVQPHHMRKIASAIKSAAQEYDVAEAYIPSVINKYATAKLPDSNVAYELVGLREANGVDVSRYQDVIVKMANEISESDMSYSSIVDIADKAAEDLFVLDQEYGIKYASDQPDPYEIIYTGPTMEEINKFASEHVRISGIPVPVVDFVNISEDAVTSRFSKKASELILKVKEDLKGKTTLEKSAAAQAELETLSDDVRTVLLQTLAQTGWSC